MTDPGQTYDEARGVFDENIAQLIELEERVSGDIETAITAVGFSLEQVARAYVERIETVRASREAATVAAETLNQLARQIGRDLVSVPSSRVSAPPHGRQVHRAVARGVPAVVRELADAAVAHLAQSEGVGS